MALGTYINPFAPPALPNPFVVTDLTAITSIQSPNWYLESTGPTDSHFRKPSSNRVQIEPASGVTSTGIIIANGGGVNSLTLLCGAGSGRIDMAAVPLNIGGANITAIQSTTPTLATTNLFQVTGFSDNVTNFGLLNFSQVAGSTLPFRITPTGGGSALSSELQLSAANINFNLLSLTVGLIPATHTFPLKIGGVVVRVLCANP